MTNCRSTRTDDSSPQKGFGAWLSGVYSMNQLWWQVVHNFIANDRSAKTQEKRFLLAYTMISRRLPPAFGIYCHDRTPTIWLPKLVASATKCMGLRGKVRLLSDGVDSSDKYELELSELESQVLYGLPVKEISIRELAAKLEEGTLNLLPEYQRAFVWKPEKSSRLVATVLCNRFVPPVVLHEKRKGQFDVVDGKQRLTSLLGFFLQGNPSGLPDKLQKNFPGLGMLTKLDDQYRNLNGLTYALLPEERRRAFYNYGIPCVTIPLQTPKEDVFEVYEDINSGGEDLTAQQVRRAVHYGPYIKVLDDLAENCLDFQFIRDPKRFQQHTYATCGTDSDRELVLRAFAFRRMDYQAPLKKFLNREMEAVQGSDNFEDKSIKEKQGIQDNLQTMKAEFELVMKVLRNTFDDAACRKWVPTRDGIGHEWSKDISKPIWDATYSAIAELLVDFKLVQFTKSKAVILQALKESYEDGSMPDNSSSTSAQLFNARKETMKSLIRNAIEQRVGRHDSHRAFPSKWRKLLYEKQAGKCGICEQGLDQTRVDDGTYAHIDHIYPHSQGGQTTFENAQLTHAECNLEKGGG